MTDRPDVDTLVERLTIALTWVPWVPWDRRREADAALSDLAARARERDDWREKAGGWRACAEDADGVLFVKRAEAAEADRDQLRELVRGGNCIRDEAGYAPCELLAHRVAELEQDCHEREGAKNVWRNRTSVAERRVAELEAALRDYDALDDAVRDALDVLYGHTVAKTMADQISFAKRMLDKAIADHGAQKHQSALAGDGGGARQVKADPAVFGESNRLLDGDGGGA